MKNFLRYLTGLLLASFVLFVQPVKSEELQPTVAGKVVWVVGSFKAIAPDNKERILKKNEPLFVSDTLVTDKNSQAQIVFTDRTLMTLRDETKFKIQEYQFNTPPKDGSAGRYIMNLIEGGFRTITGVIAKTNSKDYAVTTATATMGVRGTDYAAFVKGGKLYMMFYAGTPFMQNSHGTLVLTKGAPYAFVPSAAQAPVNVPKQPDVFRQQLKIIPAVITSTGVVSTSAADIKQVLGDGRGGGGGGGGGGPDCEGPTQMFNLKMKQ